MFRVLERDGPETLEEFHGPKEEDYHDRVSLGDAVTAVCIAPPCPLG